MESIGDIEIIGGSRSIEYAEYRTRISKILADEYVKICDENKLNQSNKFRLVNKKEMQEMKPVISYFDEMFLFAEYLAKKNKRSESSNSKSNPLKGKALGKFLKLKYK